ncbi:hypothetical protein BT63DRAFT_414026 [Microthyrium microscopicum]|uniref:INSIG domain-containing protein n=1 Tax=Microthyrium microscopicum TaxID=703497 RepID=A0A6A6UBI4_9PEZI|nr:hypothetical protein BT63DRAFT_414026 [Microthyrium microscopicum]
MAIHASDLPLLRPLPRRPFANGLESPSTPQPQFEAQESQELSDIVSPANDDYLAPDSQNGSSDKVPRSRSILNLTSSTLFGIYSPTSLNESTSTPATPWGTGAETPARNESIEGLGAALANLNNRRGLPDGKEIANRLLDGQDHRNGRPITQRRRTPPISKPSLLKLVFRNLLLFVLGVGYGALVAQLNSSRSFSPIQIPKAQTPILDGSNLLYLATWGLAGLAMGNLLPWVDGTGVANRMETSRTKSTVGWNDVIRSVGTFVGIAFAIRRLPWETTLQLSVTLSLANPVLWYLLDRTSAGFMLSAFVSFIGTLAIFFTNPTLIPAPTLQFAARQYQHFHTNATDSGALPAFDGRHETIATATWIASVLFCSCVTFGNIGRLLSS